MRISAAALAALALGGLGACNVNVSSNDSGTRNAIADVGNAADDIMNEAGDAAAIVGNEVGDAARTVGNEIEGAVDAVGNETSEAKNTAE